MKLPRWMKKTGCSQADYEAYTGIQLPSKLRFRDTLLKAISDHSDFTWVTDQRPWVFDNDTSFTASDRSIEVILTVHDYYVLDAQPIIHRAGAIREDYIRMYGIAEVSDYEKWVADIVSARQSMATSLDFHGREVDLYICKIDQEHWFAYSKHSSIAESIASRNPHSKRVSLAEALCCVGY